MNERVHVKGTNRRRGKQRKEQGQEQEQEQEQAIHFSPADLSSLGASLLSPILRSSDTESMKSGGEADSPAAKRRRLSVSGHEVSIQVLIVVLLFRGRGNQEVCVTSQYPPQAIQTFLYFDNLWWGDMNLLRAWDLKGVGTWS